MPIRAPVPPLKTFTGPGSRFQDKIFRKPSSMLQRTPTHRLQAKKFQDLSKYVKGNWDQLSPSAKDKWRVYEGAAKEAQGKGMTGIPKNDYDNMVKEMKTAGYGDKGMGSAIEELRTQPKPISGEAMSNAIIKGAEDLDAQAAGKEFTDMQSFAKENWNSLSPDAKAKFQTYSKYAKSAQNRGMTGIPSSEFAKMKEDLQKPVYQDPSSGAAVEMLKSLPGQVSANEMMAGIFSGIADFDGQAFGREYNDFKKYVDENADNMDPGAKAAWDVFAKRAEEARGRGQTGLPVNQMADLFSQMFQAAMKVNNPMHNQPFRA